MSSDNPMSKAVVFDTDAYAGNFEREICAYMTGQFGECGVGDDFAAQARPSLRHGAWYEANLVQEADDHGCHRPVSIWPSRPEAGPEHRYESFAIFVEDFPPDDVLAEMVARARDFCLRPLAAPYAVKPGAILGVRLFAPTYRIDQHGAYDGAALDVLVAAHQAIGG